jgi:hypothetical protein
MRTIVVYSPTRWEIRVQDLGKVVWVESAVVLDGEGSSNQSWRRRSVIQLRPSPGPLFMTFPRGQVTPKLSRPPSSFDTWAPNILNISLYDLSFCVAGMGREATQDQPLLDAALAIRLR